MAVRIRGWSSSAFTAIVPDPWLCARTCSRSIWSRRCDRYATGMIARGPTFAGDDDSPTGSVHIVDLPGPAAARAFAFDEPNYQAGVYRDVLLRRWHNTLGRTMWEFSGGPEGGNRYLVLGLGSGLTAELDGSPNRVEIDGLRAAAGPDRWNRLAGSNGALVRAFDQQVARNHPQCGSLRGDRGPRLAVRGATVITLPS